MKYWREKKLSYMLVQEVETMKKLFAVMLIAVAILGTVTAWDLNDENLVGKIHTLSEESCGIALKFGVYVKDGRNGKAIKTFDSNGNLTELVAIKSDGSLFSKNTFTYDDKDNEIENSIYIADGAVSGKTIHTYVYDDKSKVIESDSYNFSGSLSLKFIFIYNEKGNLAEQTMYSSNGSIFSKNTYTYDDKDNEIEEDEYNADGLLKIRHIYDDKGNETEWSLYKADGSLEKKFIYTYDGEGNKTEEISYSPDGLLQYKTIYTYDDKGNETETTEYNADGSLSNKDIYNYEYDQFSNWIKKTRIKEVYKFGRTYFEPQSETLRTITYYE